MNMYTNTKKSKKLILVLVLLILFNFVYPINVKAAEDELLQNIVAAPAKIFFEMEKGVISFLNNVFTRGDSRKSTTDDLKIYLTPETIIKGKFIIFNANIFEDITGSTKYYDYDSLDPKGEQISSGRTKLRNIVSGWYYTLRNLAIVGLLSVLVYVGIRMVLSTIAQDKAKYKVMFKDWLIALCLLFLIHYMMIGILNISSSLVDALGGGQNSKILSELLTDISNILSAGAENNYTYNKDGVDETIGDAYAKIIVVIGVILYTFIFAWKYLKREFTVILLILVAPISCITYPIDKISDGKAQAYNKWFTEFLYQVIIQPFHLLLYIVLVGSAAELANANVIYSLACFAALIPAEKFVKEMFGFKDKLGSPLGAFAGGAVASQLWNTLKSTGKAVKRRRRWRL